MRISKRHKSDIAIIPQAVNNNNVISRYFDAAGAEYFRAIAALGAMAATKTTKLEFLQATDEAGTGSKAVTGSDATATAAAAANEVTLTLASVAALDAVTINGKTFVAHATVTTPASRQFAISGTDSADADALVSLINDATYGVPNVVAVNAAGTITLRYKDAGGTITVTNPAATITVANTKGQIEVEISAGNLDSVNGFRWIAVKLTTTANGIFCVILERGGMRQAPTQSVGASAHL